MAENSDRQTADSLRKEQTEARADRDLNMTQATAKVGGRALQAEGAVAETMGKIGKPIARGTQKGGESMMEAGGEITSTGVGAPLGLLVAGAGAVVTGMGMAGQGLAEGAEKQGQAARRTGGQVVRTADDFKKSKSSFGGRRRSGGLMSSFGGRRSKHEEDTRSVLGSMRHRARQNMPAPLARAEASAMHAIGAPVRMATGELLKQSWLNLISSWGLTLIYINSHVMMRLIAGSDFFCKLGHEWTGGAGGLSLAGAGGGNLPQKQLLKQAADKIGLLELGLLLLADFIVAAAVLVVLIFIIFIVSAIVDPLSTVGQVLAKFFTS